MNREIQLDAYESRVFGVLIEKALTTPEQYPLSLNAATNAANQKVNRDPVLSLSEDEVAAALQRLEQKYLARTVFPMNSRVEKFCHNGKDGLGFDSPALAILAELLMRGPQTPGELRARAGRMTPIDSMEHLMGLLAPLMEHGFVKRLAPAPGARAERYVQLLSPDLHPTEEGSAAPPVSGDPATAAHAAVPHGSLLARIEALESEVARLRRVVDSAARKRGDSPAGDG